LLDLLEVRLFLEELPDEVLVLEGPVIKRLHEVLAEHVFEHRHLVKLCVVELTQLPSETLSEVDQEVTLEGLVQQNGDEGVFVFLLPKIHEWPKFVPGELVVLGFAVLLLQLIKACDLFLHHVEALLEHLDLGVQLVHLVFVFEHEVLVHVSDFELEVLRPHR